MLGLLVVSLPACNESVADDKKLPLASTSASAANTKTATASATKTSSEGRYQVPDGDAKELLAYVDKLTEYQPTSQEDADAHWEKAPLAMLAAGRRILELVPDETAEDHINAVNVIFGARVSMIANVSAEERQQTVDDILQELRSAAKSSPQEAGAQLDRFMFMVTELRNIDEIQVASDTLDAAAKILNETKDEQLVDVAEQLEFNARMIVLPISSEEEQQAIVDSVVADSKDASVEELKEKHVTIMSIVLQELEASDNAKLTVQAYRDFSLILRKGGDEQLIARADYFDGMLKVKQTIGQPMELAGLTHDGQSFDWESYRGKVVLVNFWATWCHACLQKLPEVVAAHEKYRERGFEVVGISLDDDKKALANYMTTKGMPWTVLHHPGGQHPAMVQYFVETIPETILVGADGKILARGLENDELIERLEKLLPTSARTAAAQ